MKHKIITINISPKKGESVELRFLVEQSHPYPRINANAGTLKWDNTGGLLGKYGSPASGIGEAYRAELLAPGDVPENHNRTHYAGFRHNPGGYKSLEVVNAGTFALRGKDLGEMSIHFNNGSANINVRGFEAPSSSEREFIRENIIPALATFINANKEDLRADALEKIKARLKNEVMEKRNELGLLELMIPTILGSA
jgi:hypothetical protein